jgi:hypothetical protein
MELGEKVREIYHKTGNGESEQQFHMYVTIYYNDVNGRTIPPNCPYVKVEVEKAKQFAEDKIKNGEWYNYLIPELEQEEVTFINQI